MEKHMQLIKDYEIDMSKSIIDIQTEITEKLKSLESEYFIQGWEFGAHKLRVKVHLKG